MKKKLLIAGIALELSYVYDTYLTERIRQYERDDITPTNHLVVEVRQDFIHVHTSPIFRHKNRTLFREDTTNILMVRHEESGTFSHQIIYDDDYEVVTIYLNPILQERLPDLEYLLSGVFFYEMALTHGLLTMHASAVLHEGKAFVLSAPSGVGKSTLANWFLKAFPEDIILNDDKPLIGYQNQDLVVYGSPWSGKTTAQMNVSAPLGAILFLEQGSTNELNSMDASTKIKKILQNSYRSRDEAQVSKALEIAEYLVKEASIYTYQATNDLLAATTLVQQLKGTCS